MSTTANVSAARTSANTTLPQLSQRALDGLKKGPTVEVWFQGDQYMTEVDGVQKWDNLHMLHSIHTALIRHFSKLCERELTENDTKRVLIPFGKKATQLVLGWMIAGGGSNLDTPAVSYPKTERRPLEILRDMAKFLEIDSLAKFIEKDIAALPPVLPPLPAASSVQKPIEMKPAREERMCYFCGKMGHISKVCRQRKALYVNETHGPTYSMRDGSLVAKKIVPHKADSKQAGQKPADAKPVNAKPVNTKQSDAKQPDAKQPDAKQPDAKQPEAKQPEKAKQPEPAKAGSAQVSPTKQKLIPVSGRIKARDKDGWQYELSFRDIEMVIDWPVTGGHCKVTGTAMVSSW